MILTFQHYDDSDIPTHSEAIEGLPDIGGYGRVYGLRDAIALDDATDAEGNSRLTAPYYTVIAGRKRAVCVKWLKHSKKQTPMALLI